jgi:hypothetical protein
MGASDYMTVKGPGPQDYQAPNMAAQLYAMIGGLPDAYQEGVKQKFERGQMRRTEALQQPILGPDGQPSTDYNTNVRELLRRGGADFAKGLIPFMYGTQLMHQADAIQPPTIGGGAPQAAPMSSAAGPGNFGAPSSGMRGQPQMASAGTFSNARDDAQPPTIRQLAVQSVGANNDASAAIGGAADRLRIHPDADLTPTQAVKAKLYFAGLKRAPSPGQSPDDSASETVGRTAAPFVAGGASGAPAPPAGPGQIGQNSPAPFGPRYTPEAAANGLPPEWREETAANFDKYGRAQSRLGQAAVAGGLKDDEFKSNAANAFATAKMIREAIGKNAEFTPDQKKARDLAVIAYERQKGIETHRTEDAFKRYAAVEKAGAQAEDLHPQIAMARSLVNSPGFNAGIGRPFTDAVKQLSSTLFGDPNAATPSQFFDKLRSGSILNEIRSLGGSGSGPVRVAEMKFIDSMYAGRDQQPASIRAVVEVENRLTQRAKAMYNMAQTYVQKHGQLDEGFNREVSAFKNRPGNEMFSKAELANPSLLSMPVFGSPAEMRASRMPRGTQFRNPGGEVGTIP